MQDKAPSVLATAKQGAETRDYTWVEASVWTARMVSALVNGVKGGKWFSLMDKVQNAGTLRRAWQQVRSRKGAAGVDAVSIKRFEHHQQRYLEEIQAELKAGTYVPQPVRRVEIPKADGKRRALGIPTVKDRVVQTALKMVIEPLFEAQFADTSYGFRPQRSCKGALREVDRQLKAGNTWVVDADLKSYFDTLCHDRLLDKIGQSISDSSILALIRSYLEQDVLHGMNSWTPVAGTPQGAVISPLLANIYLHGLDELMAEQGYRMIRYADDFVILCGSQPQAQKALELVQRWTSEQELSLHPDKTHVGDCRRRGQGFDFLGYHFEAGRRWVRKQSLRRLKQRIRQESKRTQGSGLVRVIKRLNALLRGWFGYFKHAHKSTFRGLDGFIRRRLRALLRKQQKRPGFGRCQADHRRWPNAFFAAAGLFTLTTAHLQARHSR